MPALTLQSAQRLLDQSQWWTPAQLQNFQFKQLQKVFRHAVETVPFYRDHFKDLRKHNPATPRAWAELPVLTRLDVQRAGEALLTTQLPQADEPAKAVTSSGSTGTPVTVYSSKQTRFWWLVFTLRDHIWHKRDLSCKLAAIRPTDKGKADPPAGLHVANWGGATANRQTGPAALLTLQSSLSEQMEWLIREDPDYLLSYPSNVAELVRQYPDAKDKLGRLKELRTVSELVTPGFRQLLSDNWGIPVTDMYTCREVGYVALQCPVHNHYHVQAENLLVEVIDESGLPCKPGETGRVLVSSLNNFASPLIRYELGDYAIVGEPCSCGRGLPVLERIMGRVRNMAVLPSGEQRWPYIHKVYDTLREIYGDSAPVRQVQVVQTTVEHIEVRLATDAALSNDTEQRLCAVIQDALGYPFDVGFSYLQSIDRTAGGKYEEFLCEVDVDNNQRR